jgi:hypothetical protein
MSDIFDGDGHIIADLDPMTIPPDRRTQYTALAAAQLECERTESEQVAADKAVAEAVRVHDDAQAALPKRTFMQEWAANRT